MIVWFVPAAGWVTYRIRARRNGCVSPSGVATVSAAVGGAAVTISGGERGYAIGLPRAARTRRPVAASTATAASAAAAASVISSDSEP